MGVILTNHPLYPTQIALTSPNVEKDFVKRVESGWKAKVRFLTANVFIKPNKIGLKVKLIKEVASDTINHNGTGQRVTLREKQERIQILIKLQRSEGKRQNLR